MKLTDNQLFVLWVLIFAAMCSLLVVAVIDIYAIWEVTKEYKTLRATCPVYHGMVIMEPENFTGNLYVEICNGSVMDARERCFNPLGGYDTRR